MCFRSPSSRTRYPAPPELVYLTYGRQHRTVESRPPPCFHLHRARATTLYSQRTTEWARRMRTERWRRFPLTRWTVFSTRCAACTATTNTNSADQQCGPTCVPQPQPAPLRDYARTRSTAFADGLRRAAVTARTVEWPVRVRTCCRVVFLV